MVRYAAVSCGAVLRNLKRITMSPESTAIYIRSPHIENVVWIWSGECVEFTSFLISARILTTPQTFLSEDVSDFVFVDVFASAHTPTDLLEKVRKKIVAHLRARTEEGGFGACTRDSCGRKAGVGGNFGRF